MQIRKSLNLLTLKLSKLCLIRAKVKKDLVLHQKLLII